MTRERLMSFTIEELRSIAEKEGFNREAETTDRDTLVEFILEAMDDSRGERELLNNPAMRLKGRKYDIFQDEELVSGEKKVYPIPSRYNDTRIALLLRDPQWAFAYWDVNDQELQLLKDDVFFEGFFLRVYELNEPVFGSSRTDGFFFFLVSASDDSWYINLIHAGKWYVVELVVMVHNREKVLCRSNLVKSPKGYIAEHVEEFLRDSESAEVILSSLWDYHSFDKDGDAGGGIPQRIIGIMDNYHLKLNVKAKDEQ